VNQGLLNGRSASAEQQAIYLRQAHGMRNETGDLSRRKFDRVFVVYTPIDPLFVINLCQQMQHGPLDIGWRREIFDPVGVSPAKLW